MSFFRFDGAAPLVFIATVGGASGSSDQGLSFVGAHASHFSDFDLADPVCSTFWLASDPFVYPVAAFSGLASAPGNGFILGRCAETGQLRSSHPFSTSAPPANVSSPVVCCFSVPARSFEVESETEWCQLTVWDVKAVPSCPLSGETAVQVRLWGADHAACSSPSRAGSGSWPGQLELEVWNAAPSLVADVAVVSGSADVALARGGLVLPRESGSGISEVELVDGSGAALSFRLALSFRFVRKARPLQRDPVLELLGRDPQVGPPPVPPRPKK